MGEDRSGSKPTHGTLAPLPLWALGAKVPSIATIIGILWSVGYPPGEWAFMSVLLSCCLAGIDLLKLLPVLLVGRLMSPSTRTRAIPGPRSVFRPDIDPETSHVSLAEAVQSRKIGAIIGGLVFRVTAWSITLLGAAYVGPVLALPPLDLSVASFFIAALCVVLSVMLVSMGTATLGFFLAGSRTGGLWRQLMLAHILQFLGIVDWPTKGERRSTPEQSG